MPRLALSFVLATTMAGTPLRARQPTTPSLPFNALQWRSIWPLHGGRPIAASGSPSRLFEYYFARLRVHPQDPDLVYAAALGDLTSASEARGVYRSRDGGGTCQ